MSKMTRRKKLANKRVKNELIELAMYSFLGLLVLTFVFAVTWLPVLAK